MAFSQLDLVARPALINGAAGWVALRDRDVFSIGAFTVHNGRIAAIDILADSARLADLDLTILDTDS
jgi:RNA polymerase sigma-70 factor (ECF subfamily)